MKDILVQVDIENNRTTVVSDNSAWTNIALLLEAVSMLMQQCIDQGMSKKEVYDGTMQYFMKAIGEYKSLLQKNT